MRIIECVLYLTKDIFAILSILSMFKNIFSFNTHPGKIRTVVCIVIPAIYSLAAHIFLISRFSFTYELLDAISNFFYIAVIFICFRKPSLLKTLAVVFIYIFTVDMLWSFVAPVFDASITAELIFNIFLFGGIFAAIKCFPVKADVNILAAAFKEVPKWMIGALLLFELTCYYKEFGISSTWYDFLYAVSACMICVCISFLFIRIFRLIYTQNAILQRLNEQIVYSENIARSDEALRSFRHDYKNHMIVINSMFEQGDIDAAKNYFEKLTQETSGAINMFSTGNPVVNSLLNIKSKDAEKYNTKIDFSGMIPEKGIEGKDMCICVGNLIDNAIEACAKMPHEEEKIISVLGGVKNQTLILTVTNPILPTNLKKENSMFKTTKKDTKVHGIGLKNIKNVSQKYKGELLLKTDSEMFTADLILSLTEN